MESWKPARRGWRPVSIRLLNLGPPNELPGMKDSGLLSMEHSSIRSSSIAAGGGGYSVYTIVSRFKGLVWPGN